MYMLITIFAYVSVAISIGGIGFLAYAECTKVDIGQYD